MERQAVVYKGHTLGLLGPPAENGHWVEVLRANWRKGATFEVNPKPFIAYAGELRKATKIDFNIFRIDLLPNYLLDNRRWYRAFYIHQNKKVFFSVFGENIRDCSNWIKNTLKAGHGVFNEKPISTTGTLKFSEITPYGLLTEVEWWKCVDCQTVYYGGHSQKGAQCNGWKIAKCPWCRPDSEPWTHGRGE